MGKTQSKRSVDITTDVKNDGVIEEGTGKMGKIEDIDQLKPQVNGDTHHNEAEGNEKEKLADGEATENEKDLSTEKEQSSKPQQNDNGGAGDATNGEASTAGAASNETGGKTVENGNDETLNESKTNESTTSAAENGETSNKKKKEKLKKKWSFRSISFGKKDKQKPSKKEEETNGEILEEVKEKVEEVAKSDESKPSENVAEVAVESTDKVEDKKEQTSTPIVNGNEQPEPATTNSNVTDTKSSEIVPQNDTITDVEQNTTKAVPPQAAVAPVEPLPEVLKTSVVAESAKIEVKPEIKNDSNTTHTEDENRQNNQQEAKNPIDDNDTTKNVPPPPLPNTPPPSQVMVFALSDTKSSEQEQSIAAPEEPAVKTEETTPKEPLAVDETTKQDETAAVKPEEVQVAQNVILTEVPTPAQNEEKLPEATIETSEVSNEPSKVEAETKEATIETTPATTEPKIVSEELKVEQTSNEPLVEQKVESPVNTESESAVTNKENKEPTAEQANVQNIATTLESSEKSVSVTTDAPPTIIENAETKKTDCDLNSEQIAQTIALIDEVTKEASVSVQEKLEDNELGDKKDIPVTTEPCNASPIEENSVPNKDPETSSITTISTTDSQTPPESQSSPVLESSAEQNTNNTELKNESELNGKTDNIAANQSEIQLIETASPQTTHEDVKTTPPAVVDEKIQEQQQQDSQQQQNDQETPKQESSGPDKLNETTEKLQQAIAEPKEIMNGIDGGNHDTSSCVATTESTTNGHCDGGVAESIAGGDSGAD